MRVQLSPFNKGLDKNMRAIELYPFPPNSDVPYSSHTVLISFILRKQDFDDTVLHCVDIMRSIFVITGIHPNKFPIAFYVDDDNFVFSFSQNPRLDDADYEKIRSATVLMGTSRGVEVIIVDPTSSAPLLQRMES